VNGAGISLLFVLACGPTYQAPAANQWRTGNFLGTAGMSNLFAASGDHILFADVQLEKGPVATPFDMRSFGTELALCQRYYQEYAGPPLRGLVLANVGPALLGMPLPVEMRIKPAIAIPSAIGLLDGYDGSGTFASITSDYSTAKYISIVPTISSGQFPAAGRPVAVNASVPGKMTLSAEL
jgi:hypothetical protein